MSEQSCPYCGRTVGSTFEPKCDLCPDNEAMRIPSPMPAPLAMEAIKNKLDDPQVAYVHKTHEGEVYIAVRPQTPNSVASERCEQK